MLEIHEIEKNVYCFTMCLFENIFKIQKTEHLEYGKTFNKWEVIMIFLFTFYF